MGALMSKTILLADDSLTIQKVVELTFSDSDFEVVSTSSGDELLEKLTATSPDLIICDTIMPGTDGYQVCQTVKSNPDALHIPVILLTACGDVPTAVAAIKGGAQEFLAFPDDLERVIDRARALTRDPREPSDAEKLAARIVGRSASTRRLRDRLLALAPLRVPVLVSGEAGTGHDHVVRCLHELSAGAGAKLVRAKSGAAGALVRQAAGVAYYLDEVGSFTIAEQVHWFERLCESDDQGVGEPKVEQGPSPAALIADCQKNGEQERRPADHLHRAQMRRDVVQEDEPRHHQR